MDKGLGIPDYVKKLTHNEIKEDAQKDNNFIEIIRLYYLQIDYFRERLLCCL